MRVFCTFLQFCIVDLKKVHPITRRSCLRIYNSVANPGGVLKLLRVGEKTGISQGGGSENQHYISGISPLRGKRQRKSDK